MHPSRITGYQYPLSWNLFAHPFVSLSSSTDFHLQLCSKGSDLHQAPHVCVIPWVSSELVQVLLSFAHMILPVMWLHFQWLQLSLCILCLLSVRSLVLWILRCIPRCFHLRTFLQVSILHPRHYSSWTGLPFLLNYFFIAGRFCINDVAAFVILFFLLNCHHLFFKTSLILLCL